METRVRKDHASVYASVGVHAGVEIRLVKVDEDGEWAVIHFGQDGPDVIMDFADLDSLERLAAVVAEGVRQLQARKTANEVACRAAPVAAADIDHLVGAGVAGE